MTTSAGKELVLWFPRAAQDWRSRSSRRRAAAQRLPVLECGCRDPWTCRCCLGEQPSRLAVDAYRDAAIMLFGQGMTPAPRIPEMRALWRRGGEDRLLVEKISLRWEVAA